VAQELHRGVSNREYRFVYAEDLSSDFSDLFWCENTAWFVVDDQPKDVETRDRAMASEVPMRNRTGTGAGDGHCLCHWLTASSEV